MKIFVLGKCFNVRLAVFLNIYKLLLSGKNF